MNYIYACGLYPTLDAMLDDMAETFVIHDGRSNQAEVQRIFAEDDDAALARDMVTMYGLRDDSEDGGHMARHDYTADDLAQAFGRLRATWRTHFEAE